MLPDEIKKLKTGRRELRKFGLMVGSVLASLGLWFLLGHKGHYPYFLYPGLLLAGLGAAAPRCLKEIYIGWMTLAFVMGWIMSSVLLTLFFYLVVTPIGLVARCLGKDLLRQRWEASAPTYWLARDRSKAKTPADYERQF